jgi:integrase
MTSYLVDLLNRYKTHAKELSLKYGLGKLPDWVFFNQDGKFINYENFLKRQWHKAIEKAGLLRRTPHDMRHTYATLRISKGDSLAEVSKEMGHSNQEITYRAYYKWLPKESYSNIDELDGVQPSATYAQP